MIDEMERLNGQAETESIDEAPAPLAEKSWLFLVMVGVIALDHVSKLWIETWLPLNESWTYSPSLAPYFQITHVSNTGAAFGLFPSGSSAFMIVAVFVSAAIIIYNYRLPAGHALFRTALGLQMGGALGNFIDRIRLGHVTDFLDFGPTPVFNVADASIVVGAAVLVYMMLQEYRLERELKQLAASQAPESSVEVAEAADDRGILWNE